jgi:hypothetical protein
MGYAQKALKDFSLGFSPGLRDRRDGRPHKAVRKCRIIHRASLFYFLIFCKKLSWGLLDSSDESTGRPAFADPFAL